MKWERRKDRLLVYGTIKWNASLNVPGAQEGTRKKHFPIDFQSSLANIFPNLNLIPHISGLHGLRHKSMFPKVWSHAVVPAQAASCLPEARDVHSTGLKGPALLETGWSLHRTIVGNNGLT